MSGRVGSITTPIITDGLVFNLDAANRASYPKTGTIWNDTINGNNGTLTNGPTFSEDGGGSINFDGVNDYINLGQSSVLNFTSTSSYTFNFWFNKKSAFKNYDSFFSMGYVGNQRIHFLIDGSGRIARWDQLFTGGLQLNTWTNIVYVYQSISTNFGTETFYINGNPTATRTGSMPPVRTGNKWIGFHSYQGGSWPFNGNIANASIYNRAVTPSEVLHNYNALKGRFGL